jgi:hypothetical protein
MSNVSQGDLRGEAPVVSVGQFICRNKVRLIAIPVDANPHMDDVEWSRSANHFRCLLQHGNRRMTVYFSHGSAITKDPGVADVLDCLAGDSSGVENAFGFEDWCSDYGYDANSRRAERTYKVCQRQAARLEKFLGPSLYHELLWNVERL